uniref:Dolichyl-phosphate beta-glucosyltransferase n=1 Tax=Anopheles atroparvus TaxID=41427 RepID=A0A182ILP1_ANOAO
MSAHDQMRAMLDQLMGTARNGETNRYSVKFYDTKVCKSFLLGCCPHEILASTRMDLGECPKVHDLALRADYENASKNKDYYYDVDAMEHLQAFIADCDRRTEAAKRRLAETQEELTAEVAAKANAVHELAEEIGKKLAKAEALGEAGQVEESMKLMSEIDELRAKKTRAEQEYRSSIPASTYQQQKLRVCEVCSAYLGIHDNDMRLADHFGGKLHLGFLAIREKLKELEKTAGPRQKELRKNGRDRDHEDLVNHAVETIARRNLKLAIEIGNSVIEEIATGGDPRIVPGDPAAVIATVTMIGTTIVVVGHDRAKDPDGIVLKVTTTPFPKIVRFKDEQFYEDPATGDNQPFPSLEDEPTLKLSVIIPAFDEEKRLPIMLDECLQYLEDRSHKEKDFTYEVIVVSDGSRDRTVDVAMEYARRHGTEKVRVLALVQNRGKGGAVRMGMLSSRGRFLLFADADGATKFADYEKLERSMAQLSANDWHRDAMAIGSRAHLEEEATAKRTFFRTILMHGFHFLVWTFAVKKVRDTQCGFKLVTRSAARKLFQVMHVERWAFDVELLFIAQSYNIPIEEIAVKWQEIEGSKLTPFWSWLQMGRDLMLIWFRYAIGAWQLRKEHSN